MKVELPLNRKTAKALGMEISDWAAGIATR
jgi:hypothetical protein